MIIHVLVTMVIVTDLISSQVPYQSINCTSITHSSSTTTCPTNSILTSCGFDTPVRATEVYGVNVTEDGSTCKVTPFNSDPFNAIYAYARCCSLDDGTDINDQLQC